MPPQLNTIQSIRPFEAQKLRSFKYDDTSTVYSRDDGNIE